MPVSAITPSELCIGWHLHLRTGNHRLHRTAVDDDGDGHRRGREAAARNRRRPVARRLLSIAVVVDRRAAVQEIDRVQARDTQVGAYAAGGALRLVRTEKHRARHGDGIANYFFAATECDKPAL